LVQAAQTTNPSLHQLPPQVQKTVKGELGENKLVSIEKETDGDEVTYTITRARKEGEKFFTVGQDGTLLSVEVGLADPGVPLAVQETIQMEVGKGKIESIEKSFEDGEISFDVEFKKADGKDSSFSVAADGKLTCAQMTAAEIPAAARKTIEAHLGNGKLGDVYRLMDGNEISYDAEVDHGGKTRDVIVAPNGTLESIQVFMEEIPPGAQKTIKEKVGNGKLVRIDKSFSSKRGGGPFEVEARKDGKPLNFSVSAKGRFLGVD